VGDERKPLVLCADDYAQHAGVTQAVLALARQGRLSATSAMVLSPRWRADAAPLRELRARLDVGLHLDFTSDFAIAAGHGLSLGTAMRRALLGGFDAEAARGVIERQLDAFEAAWGARPTTWTATSTCSSSPASASRWCRCWRGATARARPGCACRARRPASARSRAG
jgi:predicted glycoside hydrolase/deacetylase ChbG (UPF0249 family)